ncbi:PREDICTED: uncharacterized protein LOC106127128 [Papilio xuthus]|uniref:Uncharacterized protein LOC106127128 n=2 Tax=Papilio xuthus TaxID=66420 RepID=A0AAJ6ZWV1_PAPXU|nr:PREDICTED: uncharacterized protein LOC106127128 [Papilio xuthus]
MPAEDVSDLRDVVDAINRLCETMKTSGYEETEYEDCTDVTWTEEAMAAESGEVVCDEELVSPEEVSVREVETYVAVAERWGEAGGCELSEAYYSASSEVSLVSAAEGELVEERRGAGAGVGGAAAGHVAAMRERFESMTRANTPCPCPPDLARSLSPAPAASLSPSPAD